MLSINIKGERMKENNDLYPRMFTWLFIGLLVTFATGYALSLNEEMMISLLAIGVLPIAIVEIIIAIVLAARIAKMNPMTTKILYILYAVLTGITFSTIFV